MASTPLSRSGTAFFGGLCAGTFGLGVWQTMRYFDKVEKVENRRKELLLNPEPLDDCAAASKAELSASSSEKPKFRRVHTVGTFRHDDELWVGPRPQPGRGGATGMGTNPQGYFLVTPLNRDGASTVLVNRGWVPVPPRAFAKSSVKMEVPVERPTGPVKVVGVTTQTEVPRLFSPPHPNPPVLLWFDRTAIEERTSTKEEHPLLLTETAPSEDSSYRIYPVRPPADAVGDYPVQPETHAGYAVTWFGLSGAGCVMLRKMLTRGR